MNTSGLHLHFTYPALGAVGLPGGMEQAKHGRVVDQGFGKKLENSSEAGEGSVTARRED